MRRRNRWSCRKLVTLKITPDHAPAHPGASLMFGESVDGTVTSGAWGHGVGLNMAQVFMLPEFTDLRTSTQLDLCSQRIDATVIPSNSCDPDFAHLRS